MNATHHLFIFAVVGGKMFAIFHIFDVVELGFLDRTFRRQTCWHTERENVFLFRQRTQHHFVNGRKPTQAVFKFAIWWGNQLKLAFCKIGLNVGVVGTITKHRRVRCSDDIAVFINTLALFFQAKTALLKQ